VTSRTSPAHGAAVVFMVVTEQMEHAMEHENLDFGFNGVSEFGGLRLG
jgi:hypothetical protein